MRLLVVTSAFKKRRIAAFTVKELLLVLVVLAVCALAVALVLPMFARAKIRGGPGCSSYQKDIALAFRMWANDHGEKFPMELSVAEGGTKELALRGQVLSTFMIMSNELCTPNKLKCPDDASRERATAFPRVYANNLSYFVSLDASITNHASILLGDRHVSVNGRYKTGLIKITKAVSATWGPAIRVGFGNIAFADGSATHTTDLQLQKALQDSGVATNRFVIP